MASGRARTLDALAGASVEPAVRGVTFLEPDVLAAADADGAASALAELLAGARLDFAFAPSWHPWAEPLVAALRHRGMAALWVVPGILSGAIEAHGVQHALRATERDPASLRQALDAGATLMLDEMERGIAAHADAIVVADDLGGETGPLVSPAFVAAEVLPRLRRSVDAARRAGLSTILHSDGETGALLPAMRDAGFTGIHVAGVSIGSFERLFACARSHDLVVIGGIPAAAADQCEAALRASILGCAGGLLIADDGGIVTRDQLDATLAALDLVRRSR